MKTVEAINNGISQVEHLSRLTDNIEKATREINIQNESKTAELARLRGMREHLEKRSKA